MEYLALLRGINVGGNSIIKMADLKKAVEEGGFKNVRTYIQSGNIIFESDDTSIENITRILEDLLWERFNISSRIVVKTREQLKRIVEDVPAEWKNSRDLRCYMAFIREPVTAENAMREVELKEGVDFINAGDGVLYMSTLLSGLTRSRFTKLITKKVYQDITIRNYTTVQKIFTLMHGD